MNKLKDKRALLTREDLIEKFKECGLDKGQSIIVHSSLKSLGFVVGGAEVVIRALIDVVSEEGTLMMPSQTWKNLDPSTGVHWTEPEEWWDAIRENWPAYDKKVTPAINMGAIAELFAKWPGGYRSDHPARSFAAFGKNADYLTKDHDLSNIFGEGSPLDKLYKLDGYILLLGVNYNKCTALHLAENKASFKEKKYVNESSAIMVDGKRKWVTYNTLDVDDSDFIKLGEEYDKENNVKIYKIGNADVRFIKVRNFVDWAVEWMNKNR
ncbi:MAG: AAC(3) family N-acetyltransferase [Clostridiaceae bacterium]|nr:AAC(3) family N-acetyltransferase [Clostridiaceae bacterium]